MAQKTPDKNQGTLISLFESEEATATVQEERKPHALQNDRASATGGSSGHSRTASDGAVPSADTGNAGSATQSPSRRTARTLFADESDDRGDSSIGSGDGDGGGGTGGTFGERFASAGSGSALARRSDGLSPPTFVARVKSPRYRRSLLDPQTSNDSSRVSHTPPSSSTGASASAADIASGEKSKARDIIAAIRTLKSLEYLNRPANADEQKLLARFGGFGPVALSIFPDPVTGVFKDEGWRVLGDELKSLLTEEEYESARRTSFNAFYTSPTVIDSVHEAISRLGIPDGATILEPGCGVGNFMASGDKGHQFIGVEMDSISGRIAKARFPQHDIRLENFRDSKLPPIDAAIGNVPFADVKLDHHGQKFSLHDYFFAKSVDALKPGGILALVTSHYTLDKQNAAIREYLASKADFVGAIRLPSDAFKREGTSVVTDIVFLRKRGVDAPAQHADPDWLGIAPIDIEGASVPVNRYFINHPRMVLGKWSRKDTLYGGEGFSVTGTGDLAGDLASAIRRLPVFAPIETSERDASAPVFVPPPPERHVGEGSFFIGNDRFIYQLQDGQGSPVHYGGALLKSDGTMTAKRLAALIELRDHARRVLQSQNEGWPDEYRDGARRELNRSYDRFVAVYEPINKTTFSTTTDGTIVRRMPNFAKFREDPDAMLVMSLEDYDEVTGKAAKAAIMRKDVVGKTPPVTHVESAEEGLLVSLNVKGTVDLAFIASLSGKAEDRVIAELGDLIFLDPNDRDWKTADDYLSGNVREKLTLAQRSGPQFIRNAEALAAVQPEDVLPGDIDANLGSPWIPTSDIQAFAADLFHVEPSSVPVGHLMKDAVWSFEPDYLAERSVAATSEFGTDRANGTWLFSLALNMKSPTIYDTIDHGDREERVVNQDETMAAREKQKLIEEKFRSWVFADPDRTERLVRLYNDTYNNLRPRLFNGAHLDFPGMNRTLSLRPHQLDAVWRGMSSGNTLLAHTVGAGKTYTMAATGMKMKQAGLIKKPMYVVPNHLLEQFSREFMQLYPNARLLVASKEDLSKERRKFLTAKIASGEWDGIIVTHSSFERIGMSLEYQQQFLREQISEYDLLLKEHASEKGKNRNLLKTIEKQKVAREERLKNLLAEDKKDDGLVFDELGVDHLFIDEAHYFKNLETPTKMDRVAGIQTGGSERAFDVFMKARYLDQLHAGHGVTFATGTPISNTMVEMYTMQRFLDPAGLASRGIEHFDGWAATFGEVVDSMELSPDGAGLRPRSRFARFLNLPELQQMFRTFSDVQTAGMLNLPTPKLQGGKASVIACPMSDEQHQLQDELVRRYERLRSQKVDPRVDNALAITTDGRKLATDARMLSARAEDFPESKINRLVENVADIWKRTALARGTQMIFSDMGVNPTSWGYSPYEEIIAKLYEHGIPRDQIATMGDAESDVKKQALFEKVRNGTVRILIGSTQKMGTGTNAQKRLVALHHLDAPWKPAEVEQRDGRILRQGNENEEVAIYRYVTEGSFDAYMWQALETKAKFIGQVMSGDNSARRADDIGGQELSYAEVKAIASGNPAVLTLAEADAELQRLALLKKHHLDEQFVARRNVRDLPGTIAIYSERLSKLKADAAAVRQHEHDPVTIAGRKIAPDELVAALGNCLETIPGNVRELTAIALGTFQGLTFGIRLFPNHQAEVYLEGEMTRQSLLSREHQGPRAILNALERLADGYPTQCEHTGQELSLAESQLRDYQARLGDTFTHDMYLAELTTLRDQLRAELSGSNLPESSTSPSVSELASKVKSLKSQHTVEAIPDRTRKKHSSAEEPVTARIHRKRAAESEQIAPQGEGPVGGNESSLVHASFQERALLERTRKDNIPSPA